MKKRFSLAGWLLLLLLPLSCHKQDPAPTTLPDNYYTNLFAYNIMNTYYLWKAERQKELDSWTYGANPVQKVQEVRHPDDKWTVLTDDYNSFMGSVTGNTKTYGMEFKLFYADDAHNNVVGVVTFTYADSPARKAGLKRGDLFTHLDGQALTKDNYSRLVSEKIYNSSSLRLTLSSGENLSMAAKQMYENPVNVVSVLEQDGTKIGYLHFTSFTLDACKDLEDAFRLFKEHAVSELVLDLRYNGGGYTLTSTVLASMIAPEGVVRSGEMFYQDIYNLELMEHFKDQLITPFQESITIKDNQGSFTIHCADVHPEIKKLWVIQTGSSASASESLVCGLTPYMDVTLVGERTHGKFCGGYLFSAQEYYDALAKEEKVEVDCAAGKRETDNWGIYVMAFRYADCHGKTLSMPDGIPPHVTVSDLPQEGIALGDPSETMLATVLACRNGLPSKAGSVPMPDALPWHRPGFGVLLKQ